MTLTISRNMALQLYLKAKDIIITNGQLKTFLEDFCLKESSYNCFITNEIVEVDDASLETMVNSTIAFNEEKDKSTLPFTYSTLKRKIEWDILYELINIDYYEEYTLEDERIFHIKLSDIKKYNL